MSEDFSNSILAIKQGDKVAFKQVYLQWRTKGYYYFLRKTECEDNAKDLLQNTFLRLWQYRDSLNDNYNIDQQLFYIARTVFIDYIRKNNKREELSKLVNFDMEKASSENHQSMVFDTKGRIQKLLSTMPVIRKKIFELRHFEGYSYKDIAEEFSITEKSVDNHLSKAIKIIRKSLFMLIIMLAVKFCFF